MAVLKVVVLAVDVAIIAIGSGCGCAKDLLPTRHGRVVAAEAVVAVRAAATTSEHFKRLDACVVCGVPGEFGTGRTFPSMCGKRGWEKFVQFRIRQAGSSWCFKSEDFLPAELNSIFTGSLYGRCRRIYGKMHCTKFKHAKMKTQDAVAITKKPVAK